MPEKIEFILSYRDNEINYSEKIEDTFNKLKEHLDGKINSKTWRYNQNRKLSSITFEGKYVGFVSNMDNSNFMGMPSMILGQIEGKMDKKEYKSLRKLIEELDYQIDNEGPRGPKNTKRNI